MGTGLNEASWDVIFQSENGGQKGPKAETTELLSERFPQAGTLADTGVVIYPVFTHQNQPSIYCM